MITISATQNSTGKFMRVSSTSYSINGAVFGIHDLWGYYPSVSATAATSLDGGFLHQGTEPKGELRDKPVMHLKADGNIDVLVNPPVQYMINGVPNLKVGSTYYRCDAVFPFGSAYSAFWSEEVPNASRVSGLYRYTYTTAFDFQKSVTHLTVNNVLYCVVYAGYKTGLQTKSWAATGVFIEEIPSSYYLGAYVFALNGTTLVYKGSRTKQSSTTSVYFSDDEIRDAIPLMTSSSTMPSYSPVLASFGTPAAVVDAIASQGIGEDYHGLLSCIDWHPANFGELATEASMGLRYVEDNVLLIIQDLVLMKGMATNLLSLLDLKEWKVVKTAFEALKGGDISLRTFRKMVAPFGNAFLSWKYIFAPDLNDLDSIGQGIASAMFENKFRRVHSRRITEDFLPNARKVRHTAVFTAEVVSFAERDWGMFQELIYLGKRWGMYPETTNLYDILIYSFVADWFVQFGDMYEQIDAYLNTAYYYPVKYCICSEKWEYILEGTELVPEAYAPGASGEVTISYYHRWITEDVPLPPVELTANTSLSKHWAEAGFLVAQRLR